MDQQAFTDALARMLAAQIAGFRTLKFCDRLTGGASQELYRVAVETDAGDRQFALRRSPQGDAPDNTEAIGIANEALVMRCAKQAGVPVPEVLYVLQPADGLGDGLLMPWLDGETLGSRIVRDAGFAALRENLAYQCGEALARIHQIDIEGLKSKLHIRTAEEYVHETWDRYKAFNIPLPMIDYTARWLLENLPMSSKVALVHSDFRNGNLMVSPNGLIAVLDWELAQLGDPMRDLGWLCTNSWRFGVSNKPVGGFGEYGDLFRGYESVTGIPVAAEAVYFWEVFGSFWWACGCLTMADFYRRNIDRSIERLAIGRRSSECQVDCVNLLIPGLLDVLPKARLPYTEMPDICELTTAAAQLLRDNIASMNSGRMRFLTRVTANVLDIVARDIVVGPSTRQWEQQSLQVLLDHYGTLGDLRAKLVDHLRSGSLSIDDPSLQKHLRTAVVNQLAIDQPEYSGYKTALSNAGLAE